MSEVDKDLSERYRAVAGDEMRDAPPAHVDAAILAAAKRAVGAQPQATWAPRAARRWYVPVSLAAVLVLSVVVTLQVERERPDIAMPDAVPLERKDKDLRAQAPPAEVVRKEKAEEDALRFREGASGPGATDQLASKKKSQVSAAPPARQAPPAPAFVPDPRPAASADPKPATEPAELRDQATTGRIANEKIAETPAVAPAPASSGLAQNAMIAAKPAAAPAAESAAGSAAARSEARLRTAPPPPAPAAARADVAKRDLAPAEWLEQIAELRRQQRDREADEQFAEFRRRYPDYRIPEAMTERIAPRK